MTTESRDANWHTNVVPLLRQILAKLNQEMEARCKANG